MKIRLIIFIISIILVVSFGYMVAQGRDFNRVEVYMGDPPGRAYKVLGSVNVDVPPGFTRAQAVTALKQKAFEDYDADAVINVVITDTKVGGTPRRMVCPDSQPYCNLEGPAPLYHTTAVGTAVKWK